MSDEKLPPLLKVIFDEFRLRGWTLIDGHGFRDPEGNLFIGLESAVAGQCMREIMAEGN